VKRSSKYESVATVLALVGAVALVGVYYPIINRAQFSIDFGRDDMPVGWYIVGTPCALLILVVAWRLNRQAARLKQQERDPEAQRSPTRL
jgi:hypothetical protein